uniref:Titin n=1 Tax=Oncorhynchus kisutch TaxID=8019 RepID=A0A8C7GLK9_ONCKI
MTEDVRFKDTLWRNAKLFAINDKGKSDPRELALPVTAKDLVIEPDVRPAFSNYSVRVGKDFKVEIPIAGRPKPAVKWTKDGSILLHTSRPSYNSGPITANDEVEAPRYSIDPAFTKTIIINAGDTFKLDADVHGKPVPTIQWFKDDVEIEKNTMRLEVKNTESVAMIVVKDSVRVDGGNYKLVLTNVAGSESVPFKVNVLDRPGPPVGSLHVTGVACDKCTLSWRAPLHDGGSNITHYLIERRETSRLAWTMVSNSCETTVYKVTSLLEGNEYIFRVMAINSYGIGEHVESSAVIMKNPFVVPGAPHVNDVTNIARDSMTVCYSAPETDGGSNITTYIIEKKDRAGVKWTKCNRQKVTDLSFRVTGLTSDHEYEFRVSAENAAGVGEPSLPTSYFKASDPKYKPGAPTHAHVIDTTKSSITVAWGKPLNDGGSPIQGYIVEICKAEEEEWTMCTPPTGLRVNKFEITKLTEGQEYHIQVCAINKLGPKALAMPVVANDMTIEPSLKLMFNTYTVKAGDDLIVPLRLLLSPRITL